MIDQKNSNPGKIVVAVILVLAAVAGATYFFGGGSSEHSTVHIGSMGDAVDYAPFIVARSKGWFEEALAEKGIEKVEYTSFQELSSFSESLATGRVDVAFAAGPPIILSMARGAEIKTLGISCSLTQDIVVRSDSGIASVEDLLGKKIAIPAGTSSHYNVLNILKERGIGVDDVTILDMNPTDGRVAFEKGDIDAWGIWPPFVEQQTVSGQGKLLPDAEAHIHSISVVRKGFSDDHAEIVEVIAAQVERAKKWIIENPDEAKKLVAESLKLDVEIIEAAWPKHHWDTDFDDAIYQDLQNKADFLFNEGVLNNQIQVRDGLIGTP